MEIQLEPQEREQLILAQRQMFNAQSTAAQLDAFILRLARSLEKKYDGELDLNALTITKKETVNGPTG